jgi:hypothetical protein|tara:strand:+ start:1915 stop:2088 length:174 start_codon:yes stop_codon:yes gene_type:complete
MHRTTARVVQIERWLKRFDPANPYMSYFHIGTSKDEVKKMRQQLKILQQQEGKNDDR